MTEPSNEKLGKYMLVRHLATGGMAEIWLAEQEGPGGFNKQLVIKRVLPHLAQDSQFTQMFLDEARLVAQLTHPNIGQIYELGEIDGSYFIAMEYIEGLDGSIVLEMLAERGHKIPIGLAVYLTSRILQALEYAHDFVDRSGNFVGLVHRDVTPHNVIISNDGVIKLVDFGVAKAKENQSKTQTGAVKGKFAYMAPEQIAAVSDPDRRVDLFAVGVLFYEMLTGTKPFGDDLAAVNAILNDPTPDPRLLRPEIPQSLVNILKLALAKDRDQRYQGAQGFMDDLEEFMRASGLHGTQRELAAFVRELQGLEVTHSWQTQSLGGPRARITEREQALTTPGTPHAKAREDMALNRPGPAPGPVLTPEPSPTLNHAPPTPTSQVSAVHNSPASHTQPSYDTSSMEAAGQNKSTLPLVALFLFVMVAIIGAGGLVFYLFISDGDGKKTPTKDPITTVKKDPKPPKNDPKKNNDPVEKPDPSSLRHEDGGLVIVHASKRARIYYKGKYIADTDLNTTLRPGAYKLEFKSAGDKKMTETITVEKGKMGIQNFTIEIK
jgi:serine/threonine protein kinase